MKLRVVAIPLFAAICLASPAMSSDEQAKKGRGYSPRDGGGSADRDAIRRRHNRGGGDRERTATADNRPEERAAADAHGRASRRALAPRATIGRGAAHRNPQRDRDAEPQRYAVPRDNRSATDVVNRPPRQPHRSSSRRNRPGHQHQHRIVVSRPRYYAPVHYDYWARRYYRWSPIGYAPWSLIYGSIGFANFGFYGGVGPSPYLLRLHTATVTATVPDRTVLTVAGERLRHRRHPPEDPAARRAGVRRRLLRGTRR